ncbi:MULTISPECIES: hypothetical protein [Brasilonema]|uniref:hypothetical protein n=1 Tax=Brasilonema TaxID=383614 RepID=UPI00145F2765|nr:hypothetical protein [Brasilonema octagenarum]
MIPNYLTFGDTSFSVEPDSCSKWIKFSKIFNLYFIWLPDDWKEQATMLQKTNIEITSRSCSIRGGIAEPFKMAYTAATVLVTIASTISWFTREAVASDFIGTMQQTQQTLCTAASVNKVANSLTESVLGVIEGTPPKATTAAPFITWIKEAGGEFLIDWALAKALKKYPDISGVPRPQGPFRLLSKAEYAKARSLANTTNRNIRKDIRRINPSSLDKKVMGTKMEIHEIHPIKFGGSPTDLNNKIIIPEKVHTELTNWWNEVQNLVEKSCI